MITRNDIEAVDEILIDEVDTKRKYQDILIDSHPVTKESYGFRVMPFRAEQIDALSPDIIVSLYA